MSPSLVAALVMLPTLGAAFIGRRVGAHLPQHMVGDESKLVVKVTSGLIATLSALVLGLVTASAEGEFDGEQTSVQHLSADLVSLDRLLARYGPEAAPIRTQLKVAVEHRLALTWPEDGSRSTHTITPETVSGAELLEDRIRDLVPSSDHQRWIQGQALDVSRDILQARWSFFGAQPPPVQPVFLAVLLFWLILLFFSFGLFAPRHGLAAIAILLCSLSVSSAVFLIFELGTPFDGVIRVSPVPLRYALSRLGG